MSTTSQTERNTPLRNTPVVIGICLFVAIAAFFLWEEHRAHVLGVIPYLLLLACPIIHLFMHGSHGGHGGHHEHGQESGGRS